MFFSITLKENTNPIIYTLKLKSHPHKPIPSRPLQSNPKPSSNHDRTGPSKAYSKNFQTPAIHLSCAADTPIIKEIISIPPISLYASTFCDLLDLHLVGAVADPHPP